MVPLNALWIEHFNTLDQLRVADTLFAYGRHFFVPHILTVVPRPVDDRARDITTPAEAPAGQPASERLASDSRARTRVGARQRALDTMDRVHEGCSHDTVR
jgi:hypothetical protein